MNKKQAIPIHFSDHFQIEHTLVDTYGAFDISLINDLPLFIDPFLLFNSANPEYQSLHEGMIRYLRFLRDKALSGNVSSGLLGAWYTFPELKQTWLGFSRVGNIGRGLGTDFATALYKNLNTVFSTFGSEQVTRGSHLEKLTLIEDGIGKDKISDFATNLIKEYLLRYTEKFADAHLQPYQKDVFAVRKTRFNYRTESWETDSFTLPRFKNDFVVLTPKDILTREDIWINKSDLVNQYDQIVAALPNKQLRDQLNNYFVKVLPEEPTAAEKRDAIKRTVRQHPEFLEHYIRYKEDGGHAAVSISEERVAWSENLFVDQVRELASRLLEFTSFYDLTGDTLSEAKQRAIFLKDVIENKGGWRLFYVKGQPVRRESDLHILYRLTWFVTPSDVSREVNDGRGPADFKISRGSRDKSIIEFKLARNTQLKRNLEKQVEIYKSASDANKDLKVILYFSKKEADRVNRILDELGFKGNPNIILIDARSDNKPSASKA